MKSAIRGYGWGSSHRWIEGDSIESKIPNKRATTYTCALCHEKFDHYYRITSDIFVAISNHGITNQCVGRNKLKSNHIKFLETITALGNDVLVPINKIAYINMKANADGYEIYIQGEGDLSWAEYFSHKEGVSIRYEMIKEIVGSL